MSSKPSIAEVKAGIIRRHLVEVISKLPGRASAKLEVHIGRDKTAEEFAQPTALHPPMKVSGRQQAHLYRSRDRTNPSRAIWQQREFIGQPLIT